MAIQKILITGGNGFIGHYLCEECGRQGLDYLALRVSAPVDVQHEHQVDILDSEGLKKVLRQFQPDVVIHLAAIASPVHRDISEVYRINVGGTENLLNAASEVLEPGSRMILTSTAGVYGNQPTEQLDEGLPLHPVNHYSYSKMITELLSSQYEDKLDIHIVRPFNIIGHGQNESFFIPKLISHFVNRVPEIQLGNLASVRDYVPVEFCAKVLLKLALAEGGDVPHILNICTGEGNSCQQVIELLEELTGHQPEIRSTAMYARKNEIWRLVGNPGHLNALMGNERKNGSLRSILEKMIVQAALSK